MLEDAERKLLRVLFNFFVKNRRMPVWRELTAMTGKHRAELTRIVLSLERQQYIVWSHRDSPHTIILIAGWERRDKLPAHRHTSANKSPGITYWTQH
ncbi:hypothetical protein [Paenibacillus wenxiniae]|uniref:MarR family transcriptional regulator n=1 Tax=Paenibacillus wenxiniae TaxID=1636843 RepID=A0ABW4RGD7_9BACL